MPKPVIPVFATPLPPRPACTGDSLATRRRPRCTCGLEAGGSGCYGAATVLYGDRIGRRPVEPAAIVEMDQLANGSVDGHALAAELPCPLT